jgi:iron complex transport system substrate-binding protein
VLYLATPNSVDGILQQIETLGEATGHEAEAGALITQMQGRVEGIEDRLSGVGQGPRVFHELDPTLFTVTPEDFMGDLYERLKAQNIATEAPIAAPQLSAEAVIDSNPQVIVLADETRDVTAELVAARPGWNEIEAVRAGRVHVVDPDIMNRPGPRIVDAMETLVRLLYPELFP